MLNKSLDYISLVHTQSCPKMKFIIQVNDTITNILNKYVIKDIIFLI